MSATHHPPHRPSNKRADRSCFFCRAPDLTLTITCAASYLPFFLIVAIIEHILYRLYEEGFCPFIRVVLGCCSRPTPIGSAARGWRLSRSPRYELLAPRLSKLPKYSPPTAIFLLQRQRLGSRSPPPTFPHWHCPVVALAPP